MKKLLVALLLLAGVAGLIYSQRASIAGLVIERGFEVRLGANRVETLGEGLHLALCGAGGPMPAPNASGPCVAVVAGQRLFVVDVGTDSPRNLGRMGFPVGAVERVFLTHFHSDHIDGLGELATLRWAAGANTSPLPVHGPTGVEKVVAGFNMAYSQDVAYRQAHHGDQVAPLSGAGLQARAFVSPAEGESTTLIDEDGLRVEAFSVDHSPVAPAVGYRFSYRGRSLLISGDSAKSATIARFARGVDLLVHEALSPRLVAMMGKAAENLNNPVFVKIAQDIPDYHTSPVEAAKTARDAGVGHLLYYHIVPPLVVPGQNALFLDGAEAVFADYTIGEDGVTFSLPPDSDAIIQVGEGL